jgi:hypothetical protein
VLERGETPRITAWANLGSDAVPLDDVSIPSEPMLLSTEEERFGGARLEEHVHSLLPYELVVFGPQEPE